MKVFITSIIIISIIVFGVYSLSGKASELDRGLPFKLEGTVFSNMEKIQVEIWKQNKEIINQNVKMIELLENIERKLGWIERKAEWRGNYRLTQIWAPLFQ